MSVAAVVTIAVGPPVPAHGSTVSVGAVIAIGVGAATVAGVALSALTYWIIIALGGDRAATIGDAGHDLPCRYFTAECFGPAARELRGRAGRGHPADLRLAPGREPPMLFFESRVEALIRPAAGRRLPWLARRCGAASAASGGGT